MRRFLLLLLALLISEAAADVSQFKCNAYFIFELHEQLYLKAGVLMVNINGSSYPMPDVPKEVCERIGQIRYKNSEDYSTVRLIEFPAETEYQQRSLGVIQITHSGIRIYDASVCQVHNLDMEFVQRPIVYGLPDGLAYTKADLVSFPHADYPVFGGCVINEDSPRSRYMFICAKCQNEFQARNIQNANKAVEVTPTAVTPAADAPDAPSAGAPHH